MKRLRSFVFAGVLAVVAPLFLSATTTPSTNPAMDDESRIVKKVGHELLMLPYYSIFDDLSYTVNGNTVTLYGDVVRPVLKSDAQNVVKRIEGVEQVVNQVQVLPLSSFDNSIRWRAMRAIYGYPMLQRYGMGVHPSIHIIVDNGHVTLKGVVDSQADKNVAYLRANGVSGVFSVTNDLQVVDNHS
jgi:hyperosmotically inducible protein